MSYRFNPFTGTLDDIGSGGGGGGTPGGSDTQVQFNDGGSTFGGDVAFTWDKTTNILGVTGDINLDDGIAGFTTTLQTITPTAARTISFPDATGTVALVGGSSGNLVVNQSGAYAGVANSSVDNATGNITLGSRFISTVASASSAPATYISGTWFAGTSSNALPALYVSPAGTSVGTSWATAGTGIGVNAPAAFSGNLLDLQVNGTSNLSVNSAGTVFARSSTETVINPNSAPNGYTFNGSNGRTYIGMPATPGSGLYFWADNGSKSFFYSNNQRTSITSAASFGWMGTDNNLTLDLTLFRDAADTLAQRRTTNAQAFRVYGTFTDASNFVRAALSSTSTAVTLAAQTAGTGADDIPLNLTAAGTGTVKVNSVAEVVVSSTVAGLPAAPVVGMLTRVTDATAPAVGSTVAGGGAAAALCWYNGTNWTVIGV